MVFLSRAARQGFPVVISSMHHNQNAAGMKSISLAPNMMVT
jgi:hypothetical protein